MSAISLSVPNISNLWVVSTLWIPASLIVVSLRFFARWRKKAPLKADDWLTIPATAFLIGMCIAMIYGISVKGIGYPTPTAPPGENPLTFRDFRISVVKQLVYAITILQCLGLTCTKLSCLLLYRRIFETGMGRVFPIVIRVALLVILCWGVASCLSLIFWCRLNFASWWTDIQHISQDCPNALTIELVYAASDFITDLIVVLIPVPLVLKLHMSTTRKIAVLGIFAFGLLCLAASIIRFVVYVGVVLGVREMYKAKGADNNPVAVGLYWDVMELGLALLGINLPIIFSCIVDVVNPNSHSNDSALSPHISRTDSVSIAYRWHPHPHESRKQRLFSAVVNPGRTKGENDRSRFLGLGCTSAGRHRTETGTRSASASNWDVPNVLELKGGQIMVTRTVDIAGV